MTGDRQPASGGEALACRCAQIRRLDGDEARQYASEHLRLIAGSRCFRTDCSPRARRRDDGLRPMSRAQALTHCYQKRTLIPSFDGPDLAELILLEPLAAEQALNLPSSRQAATELRPARSGQASRPALRISAACASERRSPVAEPTDGASDEHAEADQSAGSRDALSLAQVPGSDNAEVAPVEGGDLADVKPLGEGDHARVHYLQAQ